MIKQTTDYDQFKTIVGNRLVTPGQVTRLAGSILKKNMLAQDPIIVNEKMEVIDGQHRLEVAKNNKLPIYYIVLEGANILDVMNLNQVQKAWKSKDFIESYAARGNENFVWFHEFIKENKLSVSTALTLLYGGQDAWVFNSVKSGKLVAREEQRETAERRVGVLWELRPFLKVTGAIPKALIRAIVTLDEQGQTPELLKGIRTKAVHFVPKNTVKEALDQLRVLL